MHPTPDTSAPPTCWLRANGYWRQVALIGRGLRKPLVAWRMSNGSYRCRWVKDADLSPTPVHPAGLVLPVSRIPAPNVAAARAALRLAFEVAVVEARRWTEWPCDRPELSAHRARVLKRRQRDAARLAESIYRMEVGS